MAKYSLENSRCIDWQRRRGGGKEAWKDEDPPPLVNRVSSCTSGAPPIVVRDLPACELIHRRAARTCFPALHACACAREWYMRISGRVYNNRLPVQGQLPYPLPPASDVCANCEALRSLPFSSSSSSTSSSSSSSFSVPSFFPRFLARSSSLTSVLDFSIWEEGGKGMSELDRADEDKTQIFFSVSCNVSNALVA